MKGGSEIEVKVREDKFRKQQSIDEQSMPYNEKLKNKQTEDNTTIWDSLTYLEKAKTMIRPLLLFYRKRDLRTFIKANIEIARILRL